MTPLMKSFLIKKLTLTLILGLIFGGFLFFVNYESKVPSLDDAVTTDSTELVRQVKIVARQTNTALAEISTLETP